MRYYIIRALLEKEVRRHLANRGGLLLAILLVLAAFLLNIFQPSESTASSDQPIGSIQRCQIEYTEESELIHQLAARKPKQLANQIVFHRVALTDTPALPPGVASIRVEQLSPQSVIFRISAPLENPTAMVPYETWFLRTTREIFHDQARQALRAIGQPDLLPALSQESDDLWSVRESFDRLRLTTNPHGPEIVPEVRIERTGLRAKSLDFRSIIATAMVIFAIYFTCCYLMPTMNCEERERGLLLAQALSPASPTEIVVAKFFFYPLAGVLLAATIAGVYQFEVLNSPFFWLSLLAMATGFLGIGMTVSTLARTQRSAFLGAMCYLMIVSLFLFICSQNQIPYLSNLVLEFHGPVIIHASLTRNIAAVHWNQLAAAVVLAGAWVSLAIWLFRRRGWQ